MIEEKIRAEIENEYKNIRSDNKHKQSVRRDFVYEKNNEIAQLMNEMAMTGITAAKSVLNIENKNEEERKKIIQENKKNVKDRTAEIRSKIEEELEKMGLAKDYLDDIYNCKKCKDKGVTDKGKCRCYFEKYRKYAYKNSYLNDINKKETFENFKLDYYSKEGGEQSPYNTMKLNYEMCKSFVDNYENLKTSLFFRGKTGVGKTHLCSSIAQKVAESGKVVVYMSAKKFFDILIQADIEKGRENIDNETFEKRLSNMIYECDLLIIDDLGTERSTKLTEMEFFDVLNDRKFNNRKTIISTNLDEKEINARYSERIKSRIAEYFLIIHCVGKDIRQMRR